MKRVIKILSVIMATIMFFSVFSAANPAIAAQIQEAELTEESVTDVVAEETDEIDESEAEAVIVGEDEARRDEYTKHFIMSDGSRRAVRYSQAVHYRENGKWTDIDNTLEYDSKNDEYTNKSNSFNVKFKENFSEDDFFTIENEGYTLSWEYADNGLKNTSLTVRLRKFLSLRATMKNIPVSITEIYATIILRKIVSLNTL